jgi:hypothetical protein
LRYSFEKTTVNNSTGELDFDAVTATLEPVYPESVMRALGRHVKQIALALESVQAVYCLSGFDRISPELKFIDDDDKDFFTGNFSLLKPIKRECRYARDRMARIRQGQCEGSGTACT